MQTKLDTPLISRVLAGGSRRAGWGERHFASKSWSVSAEASRGDRCSHGHSQISLLPLLEDGNQVLPPGPSRP